MLRERAAPQKAKRAAGMKFDVALVHSASFKSEISSVIHSIDLPSSLSFMNTNDFSILCVQVPFGARPRFFVPPISGNWWDEKSWARAEWDLHTENGEVVRVHEAERTWKIDGVYD